MLKYLKRKIHEQTIQSNHFRGIILNRVVPFFFTLVQQAKDNQITQNKVLTSRVSTLFSSFFPLASLLSTFVSVTQKKQLWKLFTEN